MRAIGCRSGSPETPAFRLGRLMYVHRPSSQNIPASGPFNLPHRQLAVTQAAFFRTCLGCRRCQHAARLEEVVLLLFICLLPEGFVEDALPTYGDSHASLRPAWAVSLLHLRTLITSTVTRAYQLAREMGEKSLKQALLELTFVMPRCNVICTGIRRTASRHARAQRSRGNCARGAVSLAQMCKILL